MQYDPIKRSLGVVFNTSPALRKLFYALLDLLLLRAWHIRAQLKQWMTFHPQGARILDAGSGFGQYSYRMAHLHPGNHILGVDVKEEQIADCNQFFKQVGMGNRVHFELADLVQFRRPNSYQLILSVDVMEHILEDEQVFANFYVSLVPGGCLTISTPSDQGGSDNHHHEADSVHGFIDEHVRDGYNIHDIQNKLKKAGFNQITARYTYGTPGKISWLLSMKYPIVALNASKFLFVVLPFYYLITFPICLLLNWADTRITHTTGTGLLVTATK